MISAVILFLSVAVVAQIFASSAKRIIKCEERLEIISKIGTVIFERYAGLQERNIWTSEEKEEEININSTEMKKEYKAQIEFLKITECKSCPLIIYKITFGSGF